MSTGLRLTPSAERRRTLGRRAVVLAGASVVYNFFEAVVSIAAGAAAGSIALIGFGLDSLVEMASGLVILWQFRHPVPQSRERAALRLIGVAFFGLAAYVGLESVRSLIVGESADPSRVGIVVAALSLLIMPALSWAQRRTGRELGSAAVVADSTQTLLCTYLSAALLVGLLLNAALGWWWADPVVGLVVAWLAVREGREAWSGQACGCGPVASAALDEDACSDSDSDSGSGGCGSGFA